MPGIVGVGVVMPLGGVVVVGPVVVGPVAVVDVADTGGSLAASTQ